MKRTDTERLEHLWKTGGGSSVDGGHSWSVYLGVDSDGDFPNIEALRAAIDAAMTEEEGDAK